MPILIALLGALAGAYFWMNRARDASNMVGEIANATQTAMGAARRFGFRRRANVHPVDGIDEPNLAIAGLGVAFLEMAGIPTEQQRQRLLIGLQSALNVSLTDAEELSVVGHWLVQECNGPQPALTRLAKRLYKLAGADGLTLIMTAIQQLTDGSGSQLSQNQLEALGELKRIFRVS